MKILYFFDYIKYDHSKFDYILKRFEIKKTINYLKNRFKNQDLTIQIYFLSLNKVFDPQKVKIFKSNITPVFFEFLNIEREIYKNKVELIISKANNIYDKIINTKLSKLNHYWKILNYVTKVFIFNFLEIVEFIESIVKRETPDLIIISQKNPYISKILARRLNFPLNKLFFLKSNFDSFFYYKFKFLKLLSQFFGDIFFLLKHLLMRNHNLKSNSKLNKYDIGIILPHPYLSKGIKEINKVLKKKIEIKILNSSFFNYKPNIRDFTFHYINKLNLSVKFRKYWKSAIIKKKITKNIKKEYRDIVFDILRVNFFEYMIPIMYWYECIEKELKSQKYKLMITCNEYFRETKTFYYFCKKHQIPTFFIPHVGIPQLKYEITPHSSDLIIVDGELDKLFLVNNGVDANKILIRGSAIYESLMKREIKKINKVIDYFTKKEHQLLQNKVKILLTTNPISTYSNKTILTIVINVLRKFENIQFIIKLHPRENGNIQRKVIKDLNFDAIITKDVDIFEIIKSSDLLLTQDSVTILDSMVIGTPIICLDFINKRVIYSGKHVYNDEKYIIKAYNEKDLYDKIYLLLNNVEEIEKYKKKLQNNLKLFLYNEEKYSPTKQIVSDIMEMIKK